MTGAAAATGNFALQWWDRILAGFARGEPLHPSGAVLAAIVAAAVILSVPRATWRYFGLFVTVVHELGHAFAALMTGQRLKGIHLSFNHSGATHSLSRGRGRVIWSGFWGYPAPAVVGAALVWATYTGWAPLALSVSALLLLATLLFIRNAQGAVIAVACAGASELLVWFAPTAFVSWFSLSTGLALLAGAVRDWFNVLSVHTRRRAELQSSDAFILYRRTGIPSGVWLAGFAAVIAVCAAGALLLVGAGPLLDRMPLR
jgi:hypothetical protein